MVENGGIQEFSRMKAKQRAESAEFGREIEIRMLDCKNILIMIEIPRKKKYSTPIELSRKVSKLFRENTPNYTYTCLRKKIQFGKMVSIPKML